MIGTASTMPAMPQSEPQSMRDRSTTMGCNSIEWPKNTGSRMFPTTACTDWPDTERARSVEKEIAREAERAREREEKRAHRRQREGEQDAHAGSIWVE